MEQSIAEFTEKYLRPHGLSIEDFRYMYDERGALILERGFHELYYRDGQLSHAVCGMHQIDDRATHEVLAETAASLAKDKEIAALRAEIAKGRAANIS